MKMNVNASRCLTYGGSPIHRSSITKMIMTQRPRIEASSNKSLMFDYFLLKVKHLRVTVMTPVPMSCFPRNHSFNNLDSIFIKMRIYTLFFSTVLNSIGSHQERQMGPSQQIHLLKTTQQNLPSHSDKSVSRKH